MLSTSAEHEFVCVLPVLYNYLVKIKNISQGILERKCKCNCKCCVASVDVCFENHICWVNVAVINIFGDRRVRGDLLRQLKYIFGD